MIQFARLYLLGSFVVVVVKLTIQLSYSLKKTELWRSSTENSKPATAAEIYDRNDAYLKPIDVFNNACNIHRS